MFKKGNWSIILLMIISMIFLLTASVVGQEFEWRMQVIHSPKNLDYEIYQETIDKIEKASNGRLKIELYPNGTFAGSMEGFQACGDGIYEMYSSWPVYLKGISNEFQALTTGNLAMKAIDKWVWLKEYGGAELFQEAFDKNNLNLKIISFDIWGSEVLMSAEKISSTSDFKGKKMRTSDTRVLDEMGGVGVSLPLEEVFTGFSTGEVDLAEFGHLKYNEGIGLTDVADYGIWPDFWNVHNVTTVVINKNAWNKLPEDLQLIVEMAFQSASFEHWSESQYTSAELMRQYQENNKLKFERLPSESFIDLREKMYQKEQEEIEKYGGLTEKVYNSYYDFYEVWYPYRHKAGWWGRGLSAEEQAGFDLDK